MRPLTIEKNKQTAKEETILLSTQNLVLQFNKNFHFYIEMTVWILYYPSKYKNHFEMVNCHICRGQECHPEDMSKKLVKRRIYPTKNFQNNLFYCEIKKIGKKDF